MDTSKGAAMNRTFAGGDVLGRDTRSERTIRECVYCGSSPAGFVMIPEPTEYLTYRCVWRVLCSICAKIYRDVPYGFTLEN